MPCRRLGGEVALLLLVPNRGTRWGGGAVRYLPPHDVIKKPHGQGCLLGCCEMHSRRNWPPTFRRCLLPPSSGHHSSLFVAVSLVLITLCLLHYSAPPLQKHRPFVVMKRRVCTNFMGLPCTSRENNYSMCLTVSLTRNFLWEKRRIPLPRVLMLAWCGSKILLRKQNSLYYKHESCKWQEQREATRPTPGPCWNNSVSFNEVQWKGRRAGGLYLKLNPVYIPAGKARQYQVVLTASRLPLAGKSFLLCAQSTVCPAQETCSFGQRNTSLPNSTIFFLSISWTTVKGAPTPTSLNG